jgi:hypothetical protein
MYAAYFYQNRLVQTELCGILVPTIPMDSRRDFSSDLNYSHNKNYENGGSNITIVHTLMNLSSNTLSYSMKVEVQQSVW